MNDFSIDMLTNQENKADIFLKICSEALEKEKKPIILLGSGIIGEFYLSYIKEIEMDVEILFCDNDPIKWGTYINGILVISFEELIQRYRDSYFIISSFNYYDELNTQLSNYALEPLVKLKKNEIFVDDYDFYFKFKNYKKVIENNLLKFKQVYDLLEDEESRRIFIDRINYCISLNSNFLAPLRSQSPQYFEEGIISLNDDEIFIDGGGCIGETVKEFVDQTGGQYRKIYSLEPETVKHKEYSKRVFMDEKIEIVPMGLWNKRSKLKFVGRNSGTSSISPNGNMEVDVISIDELLHGSEATFIKMDIEGSEMKALIGAQNTIETYRPKLGICIYHEPLDIVDIPLYIKGLVPEYKIYMRHYNYGSSETVCYAISI
ncbi:FkbM family methyltransferase [Paenibacillus massiliensis]|uniref:FkbM family methyltransferase n=1 Tax=Paenibacillus massiliensis TaxID=225917 RepID=UPI00037E91B6|nr:FkbM family methyltransferase [Paenibacillus massiliensis]